MNIFASSIPEAAPDDIVAWAEANVKVDGHSFDSSRTPQLIEPIRFINNPEYRVGTLMKPVQCGGSTVGEIAMAWWLRYATGLIQFNWQDDQKAAFRWKQRLLPLLEKLDGLKWAGGFDKTICEARMVNAMLLVQGVISKGALDSDTIPLQINEEIHLWAPGLLDKARRRQSQVWNSKALDISNAGMDGDQLHSAYEEGTMEVWETYCPACGSYHVMRFRFDDKRPDLGGLRFDTEAGRGGEKFSLNKVLATIRYQMPCGAIVRDIASERKQPGRYRVTNDGAPSYKRSWNFDAVSVAEIKWPDLVSEWLKACKSKSIGDIAPLKKFIQERECRPFSTELMPFSGQIVVNQAVRKNREGFPDRALRVAVFDWQQGYKAKGQLIHYQGLILDFKQNCTGIIVWDGVVESDAELVALVAEYQIDPTNVMIDASKNTKSILQLCYQNGFKALMSNASHVGQFRDHPDRVARYYSAGKPIHEQLNVPPVYEYIYGERDSSGDVPLVPDPREPIAISLNVGGMLGNLFFYRELKERVKANVAPREPEPQEYFELIIPADVEDETLKQFAAWERVGKKDEKKTGDIKSANDESFRQISINDHRLICLGYAITYLDWSFLLGDAIGNLGIKNEQTQ